MTRSSLRAFARTALESSTIYPHSLRSTGDVVRRVFWWGMVVGGQVQGMGVEQ